MSTADGHVVGLTKVVDSGPPQSRWNLVLLGDGYQQAELPTFHNDVDNFVAKLRSTDPFGALMPAINIFRSMWPLSTAGRTIRRLARAARARFVERSSTPRFATRAFGGF